MPGRACRQTQIERTCAVVPEDAAQAVTADRLRLEGVEQAGKDQMRMPSVAEQQAVVADIVVFPIPLSILFGVV